MLSGPGTRGTMKEDQAEILAQIRHLDTEVTDLQSEISRLDRWVLLEAPMLEIEARRAQRPDEARAIREKRCQMSLLILPAKQQELARLKGQLTLLLSLLRSGACLEEEA